MYFGDFIWTVWPLKVWIFVEVDAHTMLVVYKIRMNAFMVREGCDSAIIGSGCRRPCKL